MSVQAESPPTGPPEAGLQTGVTVVERSPSARSMVLETFRQRHLIPRFGARLVIKTYAATKLGRVWLVARPLFPLLGMTLLLGAVLQTPSNGVPYLLFLVVGMTGWRLFDRTVFWAVRSLDRYGKLWGNFQVPMLLVPIGAGGLTVVEIAVFWCVAAVVIAFYAITEGVVYLQLGPELLVGVAGLLLAYAFGLGLGLLLSLLNAKARDTMFVVRYGLQIWLVITPVFYPVDSLPKWLEPLATINPVAPMVELVKYGFIGAGEVRPVAVAVACAVTTVTLLVGLYVFARRAPWVWRDIPAYDERKDEGVEIL